MKIEDIIMPKQQDLGTSTGSQDADLHQETMGQIRSLHRITGHPAKIATSTELKGPEPLDVTRIDSPLQFQRRPITVPPQWEIDRVAPLLARLPRRQEPSDR